MAKRIFEPWLWTKDLHVTKEGFTFARPTTISVDRSVNNGNDGGNDGNGGDDNNKKKNNL